MDGYSEYSRGSYPLSNSSQVQVAVQRPVPTSQFRHPKFPFPLGVMPRPVTNKAFSIARSPEKERVGQKQVPGAYRGLAGRRHHRCRSYRRHERRSSEPPRRRNPAKTPALHPSPRRGILARIPFQVHLEQQGKSAPRERSPAVFGMFPRSERSTLPRSRAAPCPLGGAEDEAIR